jgi:hypothetical protein
MAVVEAMLGIQWLMGVLSADSTLAALAPGGGWRSEADPGTATPLWIVAYQGGSDSLTTTGVRPLVEGIYQAKATGPASNTAGVVQAASQIDALLGGNSGLRNQYTTGGFIGSCYRDGSIVLDSLVVGEKWITIGGLYRLQIEQTS